MPTQSGVTSVQVVLGDREFVGQLIAADEAAKQSFDAAEDGLHLLLTGPRDYHVIVEGADQASVQEGVGHRVLVRFDGRRGLRRKLEAVRGEAPPLDLTGGLHGAAPLYLLSEGTLSSSADGEAPRGLDALDTMVTAARWISSRRSSSFERLFPPSPFHPDLPERPERLSVAQGAALLDQVDAVLAAAAVSAAEGDEARAQAVQLRSACVTVLSHVVATVLKDPEFRDLADRAAARILALIEAEAGEGGRPELRNHALMLLQMRGPALSEAHAAQVKELLAGYTRKSPPYAQLPKDVWRFGFASAYDFHPGEYEILRDRYKYTEMAAPEGAPTPPGWRGYEILKAPFAGPDGQEIQIWTRTTSPRDENFEMGHEYFVGLAISRHANLGANDMAASQVAVEQRGYKLMLNAQCAGLTTRFAISRMFPDADIYSSWDSTYFRTGEGHKIVDSEACDCLHALLQGFAKGEDFAGIDARIREAQWYHRQQRVEGFVQFIGPAHPAVVSRYEDINHDGKADFYDGFLDFQLVAIAEDARAGGVPRDPGVAGSQVSGEAARGLGWSAGSMNRVT
ncbi:MAG: hypothetical protein KC636_23650, partial [Myxococcales bacterium]|nr:hypothetical protein [Myxococcales bacterium]